MIDEEKIKEYAQHYLDSENGTMKSSADHFGISKKTFQINMKKLESIDLDLYKLVQDKKNNNLKMGAVKGGQNGKPSIVVGNGSRPKTISDERIIEIAELIIANRWTIREAAEKIGISKSTLHDNLTKERLGIDLYSRVSTVLEFNKMNTNKDVPIPRKK